MASPLLKIDPGDILRPNHGVPQLAEAAKVNVGILECRRDRGPCPGDEPGRNPNLPAEGVLWGVFDDDVTVLVEREVVRSLDQFCTLILKTGLSPRRKAREEWSKSTLEKPPENP